MSQSKVLRVILKDHYNINHPPAGLSIFFLLNRPPLCKLIRIVPLLQFTGSDVLLRIIIINLLIKQRIIKLSDTHNITADLIFGLHFNCEKHERWEKRLSEKSYRLLNLLKLHNMDMVKKWDFHFDLGVAANLDCVRSLDKFKLTDRRQEQFIPLAKREMCLLLMMSAISFQQCHQLYTIINNMTHTYNYGSVFK